MQEAAQIVISEIETLERRVRAFSEFAREPPVNPEAFDLNALVTERVSLLKPAHPDDDLSLQARRARAARPRRRRPREGHSHQPARERAPTRPGPSGSILTITRLQGDQAVVEVHDSGRWHQRGGLAYAVRADHHVQETRHGTRPVDRKEERAAAGRRHHAGERRAGWRRIQGRRCRRRRTRRPRASSRSNSRSRSDGPTTLTHETQAPHRHRRRRAEHRVVAAADSRGRGLRRDGLRIGRRVSAASRSRAAPICICSTCGCPTATASTCCAR